MTEEQHTADYTAESHEILRLVGESLGLSMPKARHQVPQEVGLLKAKAAQSDALEMRVAEMMEALTDAEALSLAWAGYWSRAEQYGNGEGMHPTHVAILDRIKAAISASADIAAKWVPRTELVALRHEYRHTLDGINIERDARAKHEAAITAERDAAQQRVAEMRCEQSEIERITKYDREEPLWAHVGAIVMENDRLKAEGEMWASFTENLVTAIDQLSINGRPIREMDVRLGTAMTMATDALNEAALSQPESEQAEQQEGGAK